MCRRRILVGWLALGLCACPVQSKQANAEDPSQSGADGRSAEWEAEGLEDSILQTPYSALVQIESAESIVVDEDPDDDYLEYKQVYRAKVLETYRGEPMSTITYFMIAEDGETLESGSDPFIISLCPSDEGLYWPGVGSGFPADPELRTLAREAARKANPDQDAFEYCD